MRRANSSEAAAVMPSVDAPTHSLPSSIAVLLFDALECARSCPAVLGNWVTMARGNSSHLRNRIRGMPREHLFSWHVEQPFAENDGLEGTAHPCRAGDRRRAG